MKAMKLPGIIHGTAIDDQGIPVSLGYFTDHDHFGRRVESDPQVFNPHMLEVYTEILTRTEVVWLNPNNGETIFNDVVEAYYALFDHRADRKKQYISLRLTFYSIDSTDPLRLTTEVKREINLSVQKWGEQPFLRINSKRDFD